MNRKLPLKTSLVSLGVSLVFLSGAIEPVVAEELPLTIVGSASTTHSDVEDLAVDRNGVVWLSSTWDPTVTSAPIERFKVAADGSVSSKPVLRIRKLNPASISVGADGKLYMDDYPEDRIAVVSVKSTSAVKSVRYLRTPTDSYVYDVTADSSGRVYVALNDGTAKIVVLKKNAKNFRNPVRVINADWGLTDVDLAVAPDGTVYASVWSTGEVYAFTTEQSGTVVPARTINVDNTVVADGRGPSDLAVRPNGTLVVTYSEAGIAQFPSNANGASVVPTIFNPIGASLVDPQGITLDSHGHFIIGDYGSAVGVKVFSFPAS